MKNLFCHYSGIQKDVLVLLCGDRGGSRWRDSDHESLKHCWDTSFKGNGALYDRNLFYFIY